jgi:hypothetical protein
MPAPLRALVLIGALTWGGACTTCPPDARDWLATGFRTPAAAFKTFQVGVGADLPSLEYRSLSAGFKRRAGISELTWREFREQLFDEQPWLARVACAEVLEEQPQSAGRVRLVARASYLWVARTFAVDLVREDFFELYAAGERASDGFIEFERVFDAAPDALVLRLPSTGLEELGPLSEVRVGREWKIDGFADLSGEPDEGSLLP